MNSIIDFSRIFLFFSFLSQCELVNNTLRNWPLSSSELYEKIDNTTVQKFVCTGNMEKKKRKKSLSKGRKEICLSDPLEQTVRVYILFAEYKK